MKPQTFRQIVFTLILCGVLICTSLNAQRFEFSFNSGYSIGLDQQRLLELYHIDSINFREPQVINDNGTGSLANGFLFELGYSYHALNKFSFSIDVISFKTRRPVDANSGIQTPDTVTSSSPPYLTDYHIAYDIIQQRRSLVVGTAYNIDLPRMRLSIGASIGYSLRNRIRVDSVTYMAMCPWGCTRETYSTSYYYSGGFNFTGGANFEVVYWIKPRIGLSANMGYQYWFSNFNTKNFHTYMMRNDNLLSEDRWEEKLDRDSRMKFHSHSLLFSIGLVYSVDVRK